MKIYIQSNPQQEVAAKIAKHTFLKHGAKNIILLNLFENRTLIKNFGKTYLRNGKLIKFNPDDLQSFTLLRFYPLDLISDEICLVIDTDVFAISNPYQIINKIDDQFDIFCTKINNKYKSEVMLLNGKNKKWQFNQLIDDLFKKKIDYSHLMELKFNDNIKIGLLEEKYNHHDIIKNDTVFLHTTSRITQPWKCGANVDFTRNTSKLEYFKNLLKKILRLKYNDDLISKKYLMHPNKEIYDYVLKNFAEAINNNILSFNEIEEAMRRNFIGNYFFSDLKIYLKKLNN